MVKLSLCDSLQRFFIQQKHVARKDKPKLRRPLSHWMQAFTNLFLEKHLRVCLCKKKCPRHTGGTI